MLHPPTRQVWPFEKDVQGGRLPGGELLAARHRGGQLAGQAALPTKPLSAARLAPWLACGVAEDARRAMLLGSVHRSPDSSPQQAQ